MSYLSSDAKSNYLFSRGGMPTPSHAYSSNPQSLLASMNQNKFQSKDIPSATSSERKPEYKYSVSKTSTSSTAETHSNSNTSNISFQTNTQNPATRGNLFNKSSMNNIYEGSIGGNYNGSIAINLNSKQDFTSKEKSLQMTIDTLQRKIEQLGNENKRLSDNISNKSTSVVNKSIDEKEQKEKLITILEEKENIEKSYKQKIERLTDENSKLLKDVTSKQSEIKILEKKLTEIVIVDSDTKDQENSSFRSEIEQLKKENKEGKEKFNEKVKKYEELEDAYKLKLSQFKNEISLIKSQQQTQISKDPQESPKIDKIKEYQESLRREKENSLELERKLEKLSRSYDEKKEEVIELKNKLSNFEKEKYNSNQKNLQFSFSNNNNDSKMFSASPLQNSRVGSFVKCNLDDFEEKINNLLQENEKLTDTVKESHQWKERFHELKDKCNDKTNENKYNDKMNEKFTRNSDKDRGFQGVSQNVCLENDELKRNLSDITNDNSKIKTKLSELEKKFLNLERDYNEKMTLKEEDLTRNYEKMIMDLEEQKERNIHKISKENHELKQQNDELLKQIQKLLLKSKAFEPQDRPMEKAELKPPSLNSSPILIINEMTTPSGSIFKTNEKSSNDQKNMNIQQRTYGGLASINENQEENNNSCDLKSAKKPELKKGNSININSNSNCSSNTNNTGQNIDKGANVIKQNNVVNFISSNSKISQNSINIQINGQVKAADLNQNRLLQQKTEVRSHLRNPFMKEPNKETTINSNSSYMKEKTCPNIESKIDFYKSDGQNSLSRTDLKASTLLNSMNPFKQQQEIAKKEGGKDKKVIMFNLMDNHKKLSNNSNDGATSGNGSNGNFASYK